MGAILKTSNYQPEILKQKINPSLLTMSKTILLLLALVIAASAGQKRLEFQLGNGLAALTRSGSSYDGLITIQCNGGVGKLKYDFAAVSPSAASWIMSDNTIRVPGIVNVVGTYVIRARVTDQAGNVLEGDIRLIINGVNVVIQSASGNTDNNISYSLTGVAGSGFPSGGSGFPSGGSGFPSGGSPSGGAPGSGAPGSGAPGSGAPGSGAPGSGAPGSGAPGSGAPGSGAPGSGAPGSGAPGSGAPGSGPNPSLSPLYENYPGLPSGSNPNAPAGGRYPTPASPSGGPSTPNIVPSVIANAQAPYNPARDTKPITPDDVKRNAAFNRQLNANKGVANLISIIQQLTANVNAAKNDITLLENNLATADKANNDCNARIYDLANTRTKIQNAIKDRQDRITEANRKINELAPIIRDLNNVRDKLIDQRTTIEGARSPNSAKLNDLESQLRDCITKRNAIQKQIDDLNNQINGYNTDIKTAQDDAASAPAKINLINGQIPIVDNRIADLRRQLADAENEKQRLLADKLTQQKIIDDAARKVRDLQRNIADLQSRIPGLNADFATHKAKCDEIQRQLDDLRNQISQKESDYKILVDQIRTQDGLIKDKEDEKKKFTDSVSALPAEISSLQQELARVQDTVRRQYFICNDAADAVRKAKQNLDALNNKYNTESNWLRDANNNLERARAEKELADQGVQEIIAASTSALPFAIVPNGNGVTPSGSPAGNNPSGSPLGPVLERNEVQPGSSVVVGDLNSYLSQAYGAGVDPTKPSTVSTLYPLSSLTIQALTGQSPSGVFNPDGTFVTGGAAGSGPATFPASGLGFPGSQNSAYPGATFPGVVGLPGAGIIAAPGSPKAGSGPYGGGSIPTGYLSSFSCNGSNGLTQGQGKVVSIQPGQLVVAQPNGARVVLKVAPCTNLNAIQRNYSIVPQTPVYYKGVQTVNGYVNLQSLTCV